MAYKSLSECIQDLDRTGQLVRIREEVDPFLEMAEIHRRVNQADGPAILYEKVKGSPFPAASNLFGTTKRARYIFRDTLEDVKKLVRLRAEAGEFFRRPFSYARVPWVALKALPLKVSSGPVLHGRTRLGSLPQVKCWPEDGGAFVLLGQVYTENQAHPGIFHSNLGMYRIQMSGNEYAPDKEAGLHYQIRRDIGVHHHAALRRGEALRVSIFAGGPPAHSLAAVMALPEGMPEVCFAGALAGRHFRYLRRNGFTISADADFCITGTVRPGEMKPEGPFGDHLGYYSLKHPFPVLHIEAVYHRKDAIWPFTVVGRPPQEDSVFGELIHEIAGPMVPVEIPGVKAVHAVDLSGVHPLLFAIGSERYTPYEEVKRPQEILTLANAILGYGPCSLSKYLIIAAGEDKPDLDIHDEAAFLRHVLERIDWSRDLHFQTRTTIDTLDYSGGGLNEGSKVIMAAAGKPRRSLTAVLPGDFRFPQGFGKPQFVMPGILAAEAPKFQGYDAAAEEIGRLARALEASSGFEGIPLLIVGDDSAFTAKSLANFLWSTFTRSNPSHDIYGAGAFTAFKHWGCRGPLIIDARVKSHHAPLLREDPAVTERVNRLALPGRPLHGII